jgi:hypothetical protein
MKATTTLRRAVCIAATALALTAATGCRGAQYVDDGVRVGTQYVDDAVREGAKHADDLAREGTKHADDAARGGTKAGRQGEQRGPTPGDVKDGVDMACKVGDELGDSDDSPCW